MKRARALGPGSCLGIFSPSEPITTDRRARFEQGLEVIRSHGFTVRFGDNAFSHVAYMAGTISQRINDIHDLADDRDVDALFGSWGGKSCNQLLPHLNFEKLGSARKPILGFSDVCVLLNAVSGRTGLITFHGPNVAGKMYETRHADLELLRRGSFKNRTNLLGDPSIVDVRELRSGRVEGALFGGNLSTFVLGLVGSEYMPNPAGAIFFWESGGEAPQIVDQHLQCLRNAGVFDRLGGMVIGDFIRDEPTEYKQRDPFDMIMSVLEPYDFPVVYCPTFGHLSHLENPILPIGARCSLDSGAMALSLVERVVE